MYVLHIVPPTLQLKSFILNLLLCSLLYFILKILFPLFDFKTVATVPAHCLVGEAVKVTGGVSLNVI